MERQVYIIRDWDTTFEVSQSRRIEKALSWVSVPTKHDGKSFRRLMMSEGGIEVFGAWVLLVQIAAKCPQRGVLADADGPLDTMDLAIKTGCPEAIFDRALKVLCDNKIGWVLRAPYEQSRSALRYIQDKQTKPTDQPTSEGECSERSVGRSVGDSGMASWEQVRAMVSKLGASRWRECCNEARENGCPPELAKQIVEHGIGKGYGVGAIVRRLSKASATMPVDAGWDVKPPQKPATSRSDAGKDEIERAAIVRDGWRSGKSKEEINAALAARGLGTI